MYRLVTSFYVFERERRVSLQLRMLIKGERECIWKRSAGLPWNMILGAGWEVMVGLRRQAPTGVCLVGAGWVCCSRKGMRSDQTQQSSVLVQD